MNAQNGIAEPDSLPQSPPDEKFFVRADFRRPMGTVKPLHGINNSPLVYNGRLPELADAGIPLVRLHDAGGAFGGGYLVDVPNLFPDFQADPDDPAAYDFAFTDAYLKTLNASGVEIFYRLGVTIENHFQIQPRRIQPPADPEKWARICEKIIRHYNEGWADGCRFNIRYWEIWNEPEQQAMWLGSKEEYFRLYRVTANHLKACFPDIRIGGYAGCGFYAVNREGCNDFYRSFITYFDDFLAFVTADATRSPLDFYSWHLYTDQPDEIRLHAEYVDRKLREYGLTGCENIFNEWNFIRAGGPGSWSALKEMPGAAFTAAAFCVMQDSPIDKAMYYDAYPQRAYCGLYEFPDQNLTRTYYAFKAFNTLYRAGNAVFSDSSRRHEIYAAAARDDAGNGHLLLVNRNPDPVEVAVQYTGMQKITSGSLLDKTRTLTETGCLFLPNGKVALPGESLALLQFEP